MITPTDLILKYHPHGVLPIDPFIVAKNMGLTVEFVEFDDESILGDLIIDQKIIRIKNGVSEQKGRFICAHELGHYCLGHTNDQIKGNSKLREEGLI